MALVPPPDQPDPTGPLDRALAAARDEPVPPEGWSDVATSVMAKVRDLVGPSEPVLAYAGSGATEHDEHGSRTFVSSRVIAAALRRRLQAAPTHAPEGIRLQVDDARLVGVALTLVCAYGVDLRALADEVRDDVLELVRELLGPTPDLGPAGVTITIADVVEGDPNLV